MHFAEIFHGQFYPCGFTVYCLSTVIMTKGKQPPLAEMYRICYNGPSKKRSFTMAVRYTEEQLNTVDKSLLIQMFLNQQEQLETLTAEVRSLNGKMQLMMEQMVLANRNRFGRSSEKMEDASQISFKEVPFPRRLRQP